MAMFRNLFFDFDGTLADSSEGIYESFKNSCFELNLEPISIFEFKKFIGPPISKILNKIYPKLSSKKIFEFKSYFRSDYDNKNFRLVSWYPGVIESIPKFASSGYFSSINLITNKPTKPTIALLKSANLFKYFNNVYGIDYKSFKGISTNSFVDKEEAIKFALKSQKIRNKNAVYIGDTNSDLLASKNNDIAFIAVKYGFHLWQIGEISRADYEISSFCELNKILFELI